MSFVHRFEGLTLAAVLANRATSDPNGAYLRYRQDVVTFGQVESQAEALAAGLANLGLEQGDRMALVLPPCPEFVVSMFAAAKLGLVIVPLNPRLTSAELQYALRHSGAMCAVTIEQIDGLHYLELFEEFTQQLPELRHLIAVGQGDFWFDEGVFQFQELMSSGVGRDYPVATVDPDNACFALVYTSGTMGKPKGVELSHTNLISVAAGTADAIGLSAEDRIIGVTALFHLWGLGPGILSSLLAGASIVLLSEVGAGPTLNGIDQHDATVHYGMPTLFLEEIAELEVSDRDLSSLRLAVIAGAPVRPELVEKLSEALGVLVTTAYSLTETASTVSASCPADTFEQRCLSAGRPIGETRLRLLELDGSELFPDGVGQITVSGAGVMLGYYRQPRETMAAFDEDGYFLTGDLGFLDENGCLRLVGRLKDVIIRSGFNVYPREVETRIEAHPAVQEVVVVGVPDELLGEAICACIVPIEGAIVTGQEVMDWCRETLADDKVPDFVRFIDELPRTDTGQVRRTDLSRLAQPEGQSV
ncbi:MAG: class I adenylate-forming enzyme family protein [Gemmatimonadota bacterium]|nr:class I adenylate-forming enzyme family protein [Gemmatimonadota bacterium]